MMEVFGTSLLPFPTICFDFPHKGNLPVKIGNRSFKIIEADCIGAIYEHIPGIKAMILRAKEEHGFDLDKSLRYTLKYIWDNSDDLFGKCFDCELDRLEVIKNKANDSDHYVSSYVDETVNFSSDKVDVTVFDIMDDLDIFDLFTPISLKEFDLRDMGLRCIQCRIKNIKKPYLHLNEYFQEFTMCDSNTNKTLLGEFGNNYADFDKWNNNDELILIGINYQIDSNKTRFDVIAAKKIEENTKSSIPINRDIETPGYSEWRNKIIERDNICVCCGYDKHLEAHHLFGYKENPSFAVDENNGITLCKFCHEKYHSVYGLKNINPVDFMKFIKRFGVG